MKVSVSCAGRFHAFHLVEQLYRRNVLKSFTTTTLNADRIPNRELPDALKQDSNFHKLVREIPLPEYLCYGLRKLPGNDSQSRAYFVKDNLYDLLAAKHTQASDIFVGWADQSLFQLREAKTRGTLTIIERGSTHIQYQHKILDEERKKLHLDIASNNSYFDAKLEEKQLKEYHEADYIMVPSEFARHSFLERGFKAEKILKVPYGVDLERFNTANTRLPRTTDALRILFIGPIGVQKGIKYLLEGIAALRQNGLKIELTVIGQIEEDFKGWFNSSPLRNEITRHISYVANRELPEYFHSADLFCLPSLQEGLALVLAEAMATGLPIVATANTGAAEFVREGIDGFVIPPADVNALTEAIQRCTSDREALSQMGESAAMHIQEFSWDRYGESIFATYASVLAKKVEPASSSEDEIAEYYDEYWDKSKGWTPGHSFTEEQLKLHFDGAFAPDASVLDVGCGDASNYQSWLVQQVRKLSAIDISRTGIEVAKRMGIDAQVHDFATRFPFEDNTFDGATCIEVLEHLYDPKFCVKEIFRVLKPGGLLVTSVPNNGYFRERLKALTRAEMSTSITDFANEWKGAHIRFYSMRSFTRMLEVAGFKIENLTSNGDASIFDGLDAVGGYTTQQVTTMLRKKLPGPMKLSFLQDVWPSAFAPHLIVRARKLSSAESTK
jgi:glycosyltransferase involved in cell wall biosynthesis/2-polyprenyl-3-methyl-5-hydroxy-6-metoxy-1,4-benzoquinol methylase